MRILLVLTLSIGNFFALNAQYAPQIGIEGHTGIYKDSSIFINWSTDCSFERGYKNIKDTSIGLVGIGDPSLVTGKINGALLSLGDGGSATLTFEYPIYNGQGADFAIFENGFLQSAGSELAFLELAFVEVSSDGVNFFRFPSISKIDSSTQIGGFSNINARQIHNFAGKYIANYGTPFDLEDLKDQEGLDIDQITHVRVIDVVGSIDPKFASYDSQGNIINDPFPTPFASSGFDLAGVGVIHQKTATALLKRMNIVEFYPNPANDYIHINISSKDSYRIEFYNLIGKNVLNVQVQDQEKIDVSSLTPGNYIGLIRNQYFTSTFKWIKL